MDNTADGSIDVQEIYGLDLARATLLVLSACQAQLDAKDSDDDFIRLNRAVIWARAPTIVTSLWSFDDKAIEVLMTSFHWCLRQYEAKGDALRGTQTEMRAMFANPFHWAAFVLTGDPRES